MNKFLTASLSAIGLTLCMSAHSACYVFVTVDSGTQATAVDFNANDVYTPYSGATQVAAGGTGVIEVNCTAYPYTISATPFQAPFALPGVGQCVLAGGPVILGTDPNNVAVVYPQDFVPNPQTGTIACN